MKPRPTIDPPGLRPFPTPGFASAALVAVIGMAPPLVPAPARAASVALMAGQRARPLKGTFNQVPVLHSNQPEEVEGPGILISTTPGYAFAAETGQPLRNAEYTFNGEFGLHFHHKYFPPNRASISPRERRAELTLAAILINPGPRPVHLRFERGAVRNSFEARYLSEYKMGVRPLGPRPWNTGPGDATAIQMLRGRLDRKLSDEITIPARSRLVLFQTELPALGIANALLRGHSDGPFQVAVVAAKNPRSDADILAVLDSRRLAPGRVYLSRIADINSRRIFSRVGGVAIGDEYQASISHDLNRAGPLHIPFTSTDRTHFGTGDVQVNPLASRMVDSALDNVGTYGVRFDIDMNLRGSGPHELVFSHPSLPGRPAFTAFRGSLQISTPEGLREVHVGLRSGVSLSLAELNLRPGVEYPVRISMVYPADATPGHLLSVVPSQQLARFLEQQRQNSESPEATPIPQAQPAVPPARPAAQPATPAKPTAPTGPAPSRPVARPPAPVQAPPQAPPVAPPPLATPAAARTSPPSMPPPLAGPTVPPTAIPPPVGSRTRPSPPPPLSPPASIWRAPVPPPPSGPTLIDRYREAVDAQQQLLRQWQDR